VILSILLKILNSMQILCLDTLTRLVTQYPTAHRASNTNLSALSLRYLNGSSPCPTNRDLVHAASQLYSVLPLTGGKVASVNLWRKSLDETIGFGWDAFYSLRTTFPVQGKRRICLEEHAAYIRQLQTSVLPLSQARILR